MSDFANVIDPSTRQTLETQLSEYERATTHEIAVVTIPSLEGESIEFYAARLFKDWGIGKKGKDNGVLILVALRDRKVRIEVGYGLEAKLTDGMSGEIISYKLIPAIKTGEFGRGIWETVQSVQSVLSDGSRQSENARENREVSRPEGLKLTFILLTFGFGLCLGIRSIYKKLIVSSIYVSVVVGVMWKLYSAAIAIGLFFSFILFAIGLPFAVNSGGRRRYGGTFGGGFGGGGFGGFGGGFSGGGGASGRW